MDVSSSISTGPAPCRLNFAYFDCDAIGPVVIISKRCANYFMAASLFIQS